MYSKRIKIFIAFSLLLLLVCLARLGQMQMLSVSQVQHDITELKRQRGRTLQLNTLRGKILDRKGRGLAYDKPAFALNIDYSLSCFWDERVQKAMLLLAAKKDDPNAVIKTKAKIHNRIEDIKLIIDKCLHFGHEPNEIKNEIQNINDYVWNLRTHLAWKRDYPDQEFEQAVLDPDERLLLTCKVDITEMYKSYPLFYLETDDDIFTAQLEFLDIEGVEILPIAKRSYPFGTVAAQTIGWVGPATQEKDKELFAEDKLMRYLPGEVCGREDGVEYVCETILRGRRGEQNFDIDKQLISETETRFGQDVVLTLDIELQKRIEDHLTNYPYDVNCGPGTAAVVLDVATDDILALVSLPVYDLNRARYDYGELLNNPDRPLINRAINEQYPPGSVVKPLILITGLETNMITADKVIPCPAGPAPPMWPNCWIWRQNHGGHDNLWINKARNAIKGSCNIYFSHLADSIDSEILQYWLYQFGYGQNILSPPSTIEYTQFCRTLRQLPGVISSTTPNDRDLPLEQMPPLQESEKRLFGIGQGNLRATPLQVANTMATIARGGIVLSPRLFKEMQYSQQYSLNISKETLDVVYDGMSAVVNEINGTAYKEFSPVLHTFTQQDVKIYGKTGSTQAPEHAWFAGFAEDSTGRKIAFTVVVEGGQHGARDAAPLARDIIQVCIEEGYIGRPL
jgi:penicillin-binding protein 2